MGSCRRTQCFCKYHGDGIGYYSRTYLDDWERPVSFAVDRSTCSECRAQFCEKHADLMARCEECFRKCDIGRKMGAYDTVGHMVWAYVRG